MNPTSFEETLADLRSGGIEILEFVGLAERLGMTDTEIVNALETGLKARDWEVLQALVLVCARRPSRSFTLVLCRILEEASKEMTNEDVADVLDMIRDPLSVQTLHRAASFDLPTDEFHNLNKKCVYALGHIASAEAEAALSEIAKQNRFAEVRQAASQVLQRRQPGASPT